MSEEFRWEPLKDGRVVVYWRVDDLRVRVSGPLQEVRDAVTELHFEYGWPGPGEADKIGRSSIPGQMKIE